MRKALAKGLLVIIETNIEVLAERIRKTRNRSGDSDGTKPRSCRFSPSA